MTQLILLIGQSVNLHSHLLSQIQNSGMYVAVWNKPTQANFFKALCAYFNIFLSDQKIIKRESSIK